MCVYSLFFFEIICIIFFTFWWWLFEKRRNPDRMKLRTLTTYSTKRNPKKTKANPVENKIWLGFQTVHAYIFCKVYNDEKKDFCPTVLHSSLYEHLTLKRTCSVIWGLWFPFLHHILSAVSINTTLLIRKSLLSWHARFG